MSSTATSGKKTECPISRNDFRSKAKAIKLTIGEQVVYLDPKEFSTGSMGHYYNGKLTIEIEGQPVKCQAQFQLTVVGSKELPK